MAKRAWVVRPDGEVTGIGPEGEDVAIPAVSLQALAGAVVEGVTILHRAGGVLSVLVTRQATGFPNERVTGAAVVEWKDRTDARPQPESAGPSIPGSNGDGAAAEALGHGAGDEGELEMRDGDEAAVAAALERGEPLDPSDPPDVDESSVPSRLREA